MNITRVKDPNISVYLLPWYVEDTQTRLEIGMELDERMRNQPEDTCVLVAQKDGVLKAILVGYIENDYLFVWQGRKSKDMDRPRLMFHQLCRWAQTRGVKKARLMSSDKRVRRLYRRKYGFVPVAGTVMEKAI